MDSASRACSRTWGCRAMRCCWRWWVSISASRSGQLVIVSAFLPTAYALRRTAFYQRTIFLGGSALICVIATGWLIERAFNLKLFVF